tara:strand:+ start:5030 stop:5728 length:699 start_codon:yes stop_codon:yes gene_type:complete
MALEQESQKFRVQITASDNELSNSEIDVVMDVSDVITIGSEIRMKTRKFKKKYLALIEDSKKIAKSKNKKSRKFTSKHWWRLGKLLNDFNHDIENQFVITNYTQAICRDLKGFEMSDTEVGVICQFARYFDRNEVLEEISIAHYRDFTWKRNQLLECGVLEQEKARLVELGKSKNLPDHKKYRKELQLLIAQSQPKNNEKIMLCCKCKSAQTDDFKRFGPWMCNLCKLEVTK